MSAATVLNHGCTPNQLSQYPFEWKPAISVLFCFVLSFQVIPICSQAFEPLSFRDLISGISELSVPAPCMEVPDSLCDLESKCNRGLE